MQVSFLRCRFVVGLLCLVTVLPLYADGKFKVCADPLNPPYSTRKLDGFENKIAELFAKKLNQQVEYSWFPQRIGFIRNTLNAPVNEADVESKVFKCDVVMSVPAGSDMTLTTNPYYQSAYVLLIAKGRGFDNVENPRQLADMTPEQQEAMKIAMFDRSPGTAWLQQQGLLEVGIPYQSMTGDESNNVAMQLDADFKAKKLNMAIVWGPIAGYILSNGEKNGYTMLTMPPTPGIPFSFAMAMGVRKDDKERLAVLNRLIEENKAEIEKIITSYRIPLTKIEQPVKAKDDD